MITVQCVNIDVVETRVFEVLVKWINYVVFLELLIN